MNRIRLTVLVATALSAAGVGAAPAAPGQRHHANAAQAHRHHEHRHHQHHPHRPRIVTRVVIAPPVYVVPRYYAPRTVYVVPPATPIYIESPQPDPLSQAYWYYCPEYRAYYPHVQSCPGAWQKVAPVPPPG